MARQPSQTPYDGESVYHMYPTAQRIPAMAGVVIILHAPGLISNDRKRFTARINARFDIYCLSRASSEGSKESNEGFGYKGRGKSQRGRSDANRDLK